MLALLTCLTLSLTPIEENLMLMPLYAATWAAIHESSHALVASGMGRDVKEFKPYIHKHNGQWFFGRTAYIGKEHTAIDVAPYVIDGLVFVAGDLIARNTNGRARVWVVATMMVCPLIDFGVNLFARNPSSDFRALGKRTGMSREYVVGAGVVMIGVSLVEVYKLLR